MEPEEKKVIAYSHQMNGMLDDDYTLYDDGTVYHFYDKNTYPGGQNKEEHLSAKNISLKVKKRLLEAASDENKELVKSILEID